MARVPKDVRVNVRLHRMGLTLTEIDTILEQSEGSAHTFVMRWLTTEGKKDEDVSVKGLPRVLRGVRLVGEEQEWETTT